VASQLIESGSIFTEKNLTTKRPGTGVSPMEITKYIGKTADRDYVADELIDES
jgi:sialic acid synthase SpsE